MKRALVAIIMGSGSDLEIVKNTAKNLDEFGVPYKMGIFSAHRTLDETLKFVDNCEKDGVEIFICAAGMAAHLAGVIAGHTICPVIGIPISVGTLNGMDSLYSTVQMPSGIPVATVAIGSAGANNAAILAVQILSLKYPELKQKMKDFKQKMKEDVFEKNLNLQNLMQGELI